MARDRRETERKLIEAAGRLMAREGFARLGVNAVAAEAGVDKVLIYRYFDGLPGLIRAYARQGDFWPGADELLAMPLAEFRAKTPADQMATVMENMARAVRRRPQTLEILAWEMVERNALTAHLEEVRERQGRALARALVEEAADGARAGKAALDEDALAAILTAAILYLAARSRKIRIFNGVEIREEAGWRRLTDTMRQLCERSL